MLEQRGEKAWTHAASWGLAVAAMAVAGCYRVPPGKSAVSTVTIEGLKDIDDDDVADKLTTRPSTRFAGVVTGFIYDYELFDRYALRRDLSRVERYLQARGFYEARVHAARVVSRGDKVEVIIEVEEGPPVKIESVAIRGAYELAPSTTKALDRDVAPLTRRRARLDEETFAAAEKAILNTLTSSGYAAAKVSRRAEVDLATDTARVYFDVVPGPVSTFGPVRFEGLGALPEDTVRRVFGVEDGKPYSSAAIEEGRQAMLDLGVFGAVNVEPDFSNVETTRQVPLVVRTEQAKLRTLTAGAGIEFDFIKTDVHGQLGWQNSNFFGGLRRFDITAKPGLVLYPTRIQKLVAPSDPLFESRLLATLRQPSFVESRTTGTVRAEYNVFPVLFPDVTDDLVGYHEVRGELGLERRFWKFFVNPRYAVQVNYPFDYLGHTSGLDNLLISYTTLFASLDLRDDRVKTRKGLFFGTEAQFAGGPFRGDATDVRLQPEVRGFVPLGRRVVLAARGTLGFLFPLNYGDAAQASIRTDTADVPGRARDYQLLFFRGFFGGGPSSNRGYPLRGIGPRDLVPTISAAGQSLGAAGCDPTVPVCSLPTGGSSLWEASLEGRITVSGPFSVAVFCDAGDVSPFVLDLRANLHLSCGMGPRYQTPFGPIRLDVGYRLPQPLQFRPGSKGETEQADFLGFPIAIAFGIGEAF